MRWNVKWTNRAGSIFHPISADTAHIDKEVVSIGVDSRVEIWSKADWESYNESPELDSELIAGKMEGLGI